MRTWLPRILVIVLIAALVALPLIWSRGQAVDVADDEQVRRLIIVTPHNEQIQYEIGRAFAAWHLEHYGEPAEIDWRALGGTSDIVTVLQSQYTKLAKKGAEERGIGFDMMFGGGRYEFDVKLKGGVIADDRRVPISQRIEWAELEDDRDTLPGKAIDLDIRAVFPQTMLYDEALVDQMHWLAFSRQGGDPQATARLFWPMPPAPDPTDDQPQRVELALTVQVGGEIRDARGLAIDAPVVGRLLWLDGQNQVIADPGIIRAVPEQRGLLHVADERFERPAEASAIALEVGLFHQAGELEVHGVRLTPVDADGEGAGKPIITEQFAEVDDKGKPLNWALTPQGVRHVVGGHWYGVVLSSFGIVYNRDVLAYRGLDEPTTWSDLSAPGYFRWVALGDPSHSGSVKVTYNAILQRYGFDQGIKTLRRVFANARYFTDSSSKVPIDVSAGEAAAGMCIDFYGRYQAQMVGPRNVQAMPAGEQRPLDELPAARRSRVGFVAPAKATLVSTDPIAILRGAPNRELAIRFIRFLLTEKGQAVWNFKLGDPWGPERFELRRAPVRRDMYRPEYLQRMVDKVDLFEVASPTPEGAGDYFSQTPTLLHAMAMDLHADLQEAWAAILATKDPDRRQRMLAEFDALPATDVAEVWTGMPPNIWSRTPAQPDIARVGDWLIDVRYPHARMDWAVGLLDYPALAEAWAPVSKLVKDALVAQSDQVEIKQQFDAGDLSPDKRRQLTAASAEAKQRMIEAALKLMGDYDQRYQHVEQVIASMPEQARLIDFQTTLLTVRGALWKRFDRAEIEDRLRWTRFFRRQYEKVEQLAK